MRGRLYGCLEKGRVVFHSEDYGEAWAYWKGRQEDGRPVTLAEVRILAGRNAATAKGVTKGVTRRPRRQAAAS